MEASSGSKTLVGAINNAGVDTVKSSILKRWLPLCTFDEVLEFLFNELLYIEVGIGYGSSFSLICLFLSFEFPRKYFLFITSCFGGKFNECETCLGNLPVGVKLGVGELAAEEDLRHGLLF